MLNLSFCAHNVTTRADHEINSVDNVVIQFKRFYIF